MRPCHITIDTDALLHNLARVKHFSPNALVVAMVKANAYGHGVSNVCPIISSHVHHFGVACLEEALTIETLGLKSKILLAEGFFSKEELDLINKHQFSTVIHNQWQLNTLLAAKLKKPVSVWLKHDSGMGRLGFDDSGFLQAYDALTQCSWVNKPLVLMSHMACADEGNNTHTNKQKQSFENLTSSLAGEFSVANSATICAYPELALDYVRPGLMLYGVSPLLGVTANDLKLKPVMHYKSEIIAIKTKHRGESVGYGASWKCEKTAKVAVVAVGYGDGYPWMTKPGAYALVAGHPCPIVGRVSMDMLTVDISEHTSVALGDEVILWGAGLSVEKVASFSNTLSYQLLCHASLRVRPRVTG